MRRPWILLFVLILAYGMRALAAPTTPPPAIDKHKLEEYIRFAEGFSPGVKLVLDDPAPTPINGYFRLLAHLSMGDTKEDKTYYLTADGQHVLTGQVWDITASPFIETASHLPGDDPAFGPRDARITIVVFSDFQCPYCREFARTIREKLPQKYPKDVQVIFKDFPIANIHPWAEGASEAAHCVGDNKPDSFWAFHDWIFEHQAEFNAGNLRDKTLGFAREHGLNTAKVASCFDTHATRPEVEASLKQGRQLAIQQTPTFFLNGRTVPGALPWPQLETLIQMELNRPQIVPPAPPPAGSVKGKPEENSSKTSAKPADKEIAGANAP